MDVSSYLKCFTVLPSITYFCIKIQCTCQTNQPINGLLIGGLSADETKLRLANSAGGQVVS